MSTMGNVARRKTRCPRCDVPLAPVKSGESLLAGCPKCRGVWVDRKVFDSICKKDSQPRRFGAARDARSHRSAALQTVKCPICYYWMDAKNFENCPDLVVDVCRRHGTWLDADELQAILGFIKKRKGPGLIEPAPPVASVATGAALAGATIAATTVAATSPGDPSRKVQSTLEAAGDVVFELLECVDIGDVGDLVGAVAEIGVSLFDGL